MTDLEITQVAHDCLVVEEPGRKYKYMVDIDINRKAEVDIWLDHRSVHLKFKCIPRRGWWGRLKDTWLTWRGFDTTYVINVSPRVLEEIKKEVLDAQARL